MTALIWDYYRAKTGNSMAARDAQRLTRTKNQEP